jgi:aldehyde dehydrogenase (NAD+)
MANVDFTRLYIDGIWREGSSDSTGRTFNPFTNEPVTEMRLASAADVDDAFRSASLVQPAWEEVLPQDRQRVLERTAHVIYHRRDEVVDWLIREAGSTRMNAHVEVDSVLGILHAAASLPMRMEGRIPPSLIADHENRLYRRALGVVGVICPWISPFQMAMRSIAPALAVGNTVVLKPSSATPVSGGLLIAELFEEAGLPGGVLNVIVGKGAEIGDLMVSHPAARAISFTGSTEVGRRVAEVAARQLKVTTLELGGNNAFIVLDDADLDQAVDSAVFGKFLHQGELCTSVNRFLIQEQLEGQFLERYVAKVKGLKVGNPADSLTVVGPLISSAHVERILEKIHQSIAMGASVELEGAVKGNLMDPVILSGVTNEMPIARTEILGPVAPLITFGDDEEAIRIANDTEHGLSAAVHSRDRERAARVARHLRTGMVHVNDTPINEQPHVAFGGEKGSGIGRMGAEWAIERLTTLQWVSVQHEPRPYPEAFGLGKPEETELNVSEMSQTLI